MDFRECTIDGTRYGDNGFSPESEGARGARLRQEKQDAQPDEETRPSTSSERRESDPKNNGNIELDEDPFGESGEEAEFKRKRKDIMKEYKGQIKKLFDPTYSCLDENRLSFADPQIFKDMKTSEMSKLDDDHGGFVKEFFLLLSLCHTVVMEKSLNKRKRMKTRKGSTRKNPLLQIPIAYSQRKRSDEVYQESQKCSRVEALIY
jgi:phospholipid-translocating ATPase